MTILVITSSFPRYDGDYFGPWILDYTREMVKQGCNVIVVAPQVADSDKFILSKENHDVRRFKYWFSSKFQRLVHPPGMIPQLKTNPLRLLQLPFLLRGYWKAVKKVIRETEIDIIHTQWVIPGGFIGALFKLKYKIPLVITSQGAEFYLPQWHPFSWLTKWTIKRTDKLIPVSEMMSERAKIYGATEDQMQVLPNAVSTDVFNPSVESNFRRDHGIPEEAIVILTVRRLVKEKKVEDVIKAYSDMLDDQSRDVWLVIGGDGPERGKLERIAQAKGASNKILFIGYVDNKELPPIYAASDIYILSSAQEGLSLSLLEAMASGNWVISTNTTGAETLIKDNINGSLYNVGDISGLIEALSNSFVRVKNDKNKFSYLPKTYDVQEMIGNTIKLYNSL